MRTGVLAALLLADGAMAAAQDTAQGETLPAAVAAELEKLPPLATVVTVCPPPSSTAICVASLTPVKLVVRTHLGSKISTSGEWFDIELAEPILINGAVAVPAGTRGKGEVVHAKKSGGSGASGELVLAARYLEIDGRRLRLRSMHFAQAGEDKIGTVNTLNVASVASPIPGLSLIGFFVKGKGIDLPEGTLAIAKTAEPFLIDLSPQTAVPTTQDPASGEAPEPFQPPSQ